MKFRPSKVWLRRGATIATLALVPLILVGVFLAMHAEFRAVAQLRDVSERTDAKRDLFADILIAHADVETGVRGFIITADDRYLEPYNIALLRRESLFSAIEDQGEPEIHAALARLRKLSDAKLANAALNVSDVRAGRIRQARERVATGNGKALMDEIRRELADLDAHEAAKLAQLTERSSASRAMLERSVTAMLIGLALLLAMVTMIVNRSFRMRSEAMDRAERLSDRQKALFAGTVDGVMLLDGRGRILRMNPSVSRIFGYSEEELLGQHNMVLLETPYSMEQSMAWLQSVGVAGKHGAGRRQEFTGKRSDGTTFDTEVAISMIHGETEKNYVAAIRDISDRKRAERMKTEFVSTVSHELRTPLTSIGGSLGLLEGGAAGPLEEKAKRLVEIAKSNCDRLIRLINDILDIEKIESGKMEFDLRRMQVGPLIGRTVSSMNGFADQHGVTLTTVLPPWPQCVVGDPDKLEQLLTNLVSNAVKHTPKGGEVEIFSTHDGGHVRIEVRDRGQGIPTEFRSRIFGKFAMADASDSRLKGGTGLGLAIAREIARRHGGDVGFDDRQGGGTVFHVDIPSVSAERTDGRTDLDQDLPSVLHIDDDDDTLAVVASAFEGKAHVMTAHTLAEAREVLNKSDVAAAILDIGLAYENGLDMIAELRKHREAMPILTFTAYDDMRTAEGVDRVLIKSRTSVSDLVDTTLLLVGERRRAA
ncbi:CHASE3 domain-containing protein [Qipengyuania sp. 6B39]|uniref:ATP-binding protein n=1 Tax=Qipengyuania proteolytica TaxID=2867239 RepID=UPI001C89577F|nr:ATP-binding protein [Qipengyuania proteolytica]MBX7497006.1 CHASE3 domain-containing protein [Qipengyuania proteolytica]